MRPLAGAALVIGFCVLLTGCAARLGPFPPTLTGDETLAFGHVSTRLTAPSTRYFAPEIRFLELANQDTGERFRIDVQAAESSLVLALPPGTYELSRIMINEGAFQAMANPGPVFQLGAGTVTYVGTWTFGIAAPFYDRKLTLSVSDELGEATTELTARYPALSTRSIISGLPAPAESVTRLYETEPYPLIWYFRRHHTT